MHYFSQLPLISHFAFTVVKLLAPDIVLRHFINVASVLIFFFFITQVSLPLRTFGFFIRHTIFFPFYS